MTQILNIPAPTKEKHPKQRSINISDLFLTRFSPPWTRPPSLPAYTWRNWVLNQPVAMAYRETLIANLLNLDWKITPRNAVYKKELEATVKYYTRLLQQGGNYLGTDYTGLVEWVAGDVLDLPFGGAAEIGRKGDVAGGRVAWLRPLDAGTLYPTLNQEYPVVQYYQGYDAVAFPDYAISRTYLSPQSYIYREGWGMAPPEKAYFAINLLNTGDKYYANLLLDVPTAGILDLGDMEKSSAEEWVTAFKTFVNDTSTSFRVPVLYEHNNPVSFIPFGKVPNDIMFDRITMKYAALLGAAYGASPSDIGMQSSSSSGETLAGSIRDERKTRKTGFARLKLKMKYFFDRILPDSLEFNFVDYDDELNVAMGRARLASATAFNLLQSNGNFSQQEVRSQFIQEGLISINIPDKLPKDAKAKQEAKFWHDTLGQPANNTATDSQKKKPTEPEAVGNPKAPSGGGEGDIKKLASLTVKSRTKNLNEVVDTLIHQITPKVYEALQGIGEDEIYLVKSTINNSLFDDEDILQLQPILKGLVDNRPLVQLKFNGLEDELKMLSGVDDSVSSFAKVLERRINKGINPFLVKALTVMLNDTIITDDVLSTSYEDIYTSMSLSLEKLDEMVDVFVSDEVDQILHEIEVQQSKIVRQPAVVTVERSNPAPTINLPAITVNVPQQERSTAEKEDMNIVINNPQNVQLESDRQTKVMKSMTDTIAQVSKALDTNKPVINVQVNPTPVTVQNDVLVDVPQQAAPEVTVNVEPTPVTVQNAVKMDAPVVNVSVPKVKKEVQTVQRDRMGNIASTETKVEYED